MIKFEVVRWKNLLSTGNNFTEINLDKRKNTLIIGENGTGKSTILDALTFVLFGKAFRRINKPGLINSVNDKNCVVEITFSTNNKEYKIVRGIKPTIFEIHCDGTLLNQDSASRDYQEYLEKFILKMNHKSFTQIVILGSASFVPFMQLSPADRRAIIEDLLDIQIFSVMNTIVKQRLIRNKEDTEMLRIETVGKEEKKAFVVKTLDSLKQNNQEKLVSLQTHRDVYLQNIESLTKEIGELDQNREDILKNTGAHLSLKDKHKKLIALQSKIETNLKRNEKDIEFYTINDNCPTCRQSIEPAFKAITVDDTNKKIEEFSSGLEKIKTDIDVCIQDICDIDDMLNKAQNFRNEITSKRTKLSSYISMVNDVEDSIKNIQDFDKLVLENEKELQLISDQVLHNQNKKLDLLNDRTYIETAINLLKDTGIKTKIIKQYIPIINKIINKYLSQMGFFVNFNIDENFEETIKSRYCDEFSYQNFSEGEKMKIDMSLMLTWRAIAKMKNSVNTNLLILDEVFDSSLDSNSTDGLMNILKSFDSDTNVFVISHKGDALMDKFPTILKFEKHKNFSRLAV